MEKGAAHFFFVTLMAPSTGQVHIYYSICTNVAYKNSLRLHCSLKCPMKRVGRATTCARDLLRTQNEKCLSLLQFK